VNPTYGSGQKAREEVPVSNSGTQNQFTSLVGKSQLLFYVGASTVADDKTSGLGNGVVQGAQQHLNGNYCLKKVR